MPPNGVSEISGRFLPAVPHVFTFIRGTNKPRAELLVIISGTSVQHRFNQDDGPKLDRAAHGLHEDTGTQ